MQLNFIRRIDCWGNTFYNIRRYNSYEEREVTIGSIERNPLTNSHVFTRWYYAFSELPQDEQEQINDFIDAQNNLMLNFID